MVLPFATSEITNHLIPEQSNDPVENWLDRVTRQLSPDRDLQLEVRQELRSHLDESVAAFREGGRSEGDARDEALRALGDEAELADGLWRANRRRMRVRSIVAWAARLLLPPAVVAMIVFLAGGALLTVAFLRPQVLGFNLARSGDADRAQQLRAWHIARATPVGRRLFEQDQAVGIDRLPIARQLAEQNPSDAMLYANYAFVAAGQRITINDGTQDQSAPTDFAQVAERLAIFAEGEKREPGNALYPGMTAALLFEVSSRRDEQTVRTDRGMDEDDPQNWPHEIVFDPARHAEALAAVRRAVAAPYLRTYRIELIDRRMEGLAADRVADVWSFTKLETGASTYNRPDFYSASRHLFAIAIDAAKEKRYADAKQIIHDLRFYAGKSAEGARCSSDVRDSLNFRGSADELEVRVETLASGAEPGRAVRNQKRALSSLMWAPLSTHDDYVQRHLAEMPLYLGRWWGRSVELDVTPIRKAEYSVVDQFGVAMVAGGLLIGAALYAAAAGVQRVRAWRVGGTPPMLFVGWRRAAWVVAIGAVAPMVIFLLYTDLDPLSGRSVGLNNPAMLTRVLLEYLAMVVVVLALVATLARRAIFARMIELGTAMKPDASAFGIRELVLWSIAILAAACLIGSAVVGNGLFDAIPDYIERRLEKPLLMTAWLLIVLVGVWCWKRQRARSESRTPSVIFSGAMARSAFPLVLTAALVVALMGVPRYFSEMENVRAFIGEQPKRLTISPVGGTGYDLVREKMLQEYDFLKSAEVQ